MFILQKKQHMITFEKKYGIFAKAKAKSNWSVIKIADYFSAVWLINQSFQL